ncbi:MAG: hypothetical protein AAF721_06320 [Myxococcota bacterium]
MRARGTIAAAALLVLVACNAKDEDSNPNADAAAAAPQDRSLPPTATPDRDLVVSLQALGEEYSMTGVFHPARWKALHGRAAPLAAALPDVRRDWPAMAAPDHVVLWAFDNLFALGGVDTGATVDGLDPSRPIVFGLNRPSVPDRPPGGLTPRVLGGQVTLEMRHELRLPSRDPATLVASLDRALGNVGDDHPEFVADHAGAKCRATRGQYVAMVPGKDHVRVIAAVGGFDPDAARLKAAIATPSPSTEVTPAMLAATQADAVGGVVVRTSRLPAVAALLGALESAKALSVVSPDQRLMAAMKSATLILDSEAVMGDAPTEFDDWALTLTSSVDAVGLRMLGSMTPAGEAALKAAAGEAPRFALKGAPPPVDAVVSLNTPAMLGAAVEPAFARGSQDAAALRMKMLRCGSTCNNRLLLRSPMGLAKLGVRLAGVEGLDLPRPTVAHVVVTDTSAATPSFAAAFELAAKPDLSSLSARAAAFDVTVSEGVRGGKPVVLVGRGVDPKAVFDLSKAGQSPSELAVASATVAPLATDVLALLGPEGEALGRLVGSAGDSAHLGAWLRHRDRALAYDLVLFTNGPPAAPALPDLASATWSSPRRLTASDEVDACLVRATVAASAAVEGLATLAPDSRLQSLAEGLEAVHGIETECKAADADAKAVLAQLQAYLRDTGTAMVGDLGLTAAEAILKSACERTADAATCEDAKVAATLKEASLPRIDAICSRKSDTANPGVGVQITADGIHVGLTPVEAEADALAAALTDRAPLILGGLIPLLGRPTLYIDRDRPYAEVEPVLRAIEELHAPLVSLALLGGGAVRAQLASADALKDFPPTSPTTVEITKGGFSVGGASLPATASPTELAAHLPFDPESPTDTVLEPAADAPWSAVMAALASRPCKALPATLVVR